jgi:hypothetical protein
MYKTEIIKNTPQTPRLESLPPTPFVVESGDSNNLYNISRIAGSSNRFLVTSIELGISYDNGYTTEKILNFINDGYWILRKSKITVE